MRTVVLLITAAVLFMESNVDEGPTFIVSNAL
jgi:hypothetical protein